MYSKRLRGTIFVYAHVLYMSCPPNSFGARIQTMDFPPSRKSIITEGHEKQSGPPHHRMTSSGSVHTFHANYTKA